MNYNINNLTTTQTQNITPMKKNSANIKNFKTILSELINFTTFELQNNPKYENDYLLVFKLQGQKTEHLGLSIGIAYNGFSFNNEGKLNPYNNEDITTKITLIKEDKITDPLEILLPFDLFCFKLRTFNRESLPFRSSFEVYLAKFKEIFNLTTPSINNDNTINNNLEEIKKFAATEIENFNFKKYIFENNTKDKNQIEQQINQDQEIQISLLHIINLEEELNRLKKEYSFKLSSKKEETGYTKLERGLYKNQYEYHDALKALEEKIKKAPKLTLKTKQEIFKTLTEKENTFFDIDFFCM
jgi:hypothetical protein